MAAGSYGPLPSPASGGLPASGDQRTLGRELYRRGGGRGGFSPGGMSDQGDEAEWLRYLADLSRGVAPKPRATGFAAVRRK